MSVIEKLRNARGPLFTFELLPPLKGHSIEKIYSTIDRLVEFQPAYINFTSHRNEITYKERPDGLLENYSGHYAGKNRRCIQEHSPRGHADIFDSFCI